MTGCQCTGPGWCERHKVNKPASWVHACQTNEKYFLAWEEGRGPGQKNELISAKKSVVDGGPGTELTAMLARFGIKYTPGCLCADRARLMNVWGAAKCRQYLSKISGWMREEAQKRGLPFMDIAAKGMILVAIRRAEKKERARKSISSADSAV